MWPAALTRRWRVAGGEGCGTPLVIGSRVYTFTRVADREVLTALEARTGRTIWQRGYAAPYTPRRPRRRDAGGLR